MKNEYDTSKISSDIRVRIDGVGVTDNISVPNTSYKLEITTNATDQLNHNPLLVRNINPHKPNSGLMIPGTNAGFVYETLVTASRVDGRWITTVDDPSVTYEVVDLAGIDDNLSITINTLTSDRVQYNINDDNLDHGLVVDISTDTYTRSKISESDSIDSLYTDDVLISIDDYEFGTTIQRYNNDIDRILPSTIITSTDEVVVDRRDPVVETIEDHDQLFLIDFRLISDNLIVVSSINSDSIIDTSKLISITGSDELIDGFISDEESNIIELDKSITSELIDEVVNPVPSNIIDIDLGDDDVDPVTSSD
jgi:hypothetical protein